MVRHDGYPEYRFIGAPDRQWLIDQASGTLALADPASGRVVVRIDTERPGHDLEVAQGPTAAYLIDHTDGEMLTIDEKVVRLTATQSIPELASTGTRWDYHVGNSAIVALPEQGLGGVVIPAQGEPRGFELAPSRSAALVAADAGVWQLLGDDRRTEVIQPQGGRLLLDTQSSDSAISAIGNDVLVLQRRTGELNWLAGATKVQLSSEIDTDHAAIQVAAPTGDCLWIGAGDELSCVGPSGIVERRQIDDGMQIHAVDQLAVVERTAVVINDRGVINRIDLDTGHVTRVPFDAVGAIEATRRDRDVWIEDRASSTAIAIRGTSTHQFDKLDPRAPLFAASGVPLDVGGIGDRSGSPGTSASDPSGNPTHEATVVAVGPDDDGIAEAPIALDDDAAGRGGHSFTINVLANDFDPDGDPIAISGNSDPAHGTVDIIAPGLVQFRSTDGFVGRDSFTYTITDATGRPETGRVRVEILAADGPNRAPVANPDTRQTAIGASVSLDVLANDSDDADDAQLTIVGLSIIDPDDGTLVIAERGDGHQILKFTARPAASGRTLSFTYRANDGNQVSAPTTVTLAVAGKSSINRPPIAVADAARVRAGRTISIPVLANDFDPDGDQLSLLVPSVPAGQAAVIGDSIELTTSASSRGQITFDYTVVDDDGAEATGTVLVQLVDPAAPNIAPIARPDRRTSTGLAVQLDPVLNDFDPDGDPLMLVEITAPPGLVVSQSNNLLTMTPDSNFSGGVVRYQVADASGTTTDGTILVIVERKASSTRTPVVVPPTNPAGPPTTTPSSAPPTTSPSGSTIPTPTPPTTPTAPTPPTVPTPGAPPTTGSPPVTTPQPPGPTTGNLAPITVADTASTATGAAVTIDVIGNDRDPEGGALTARLAGLPAAAEGRVEPAGNGSFTFFPTPGFVGSTSFTYLAVDPQGIFSPATLVSISVTGCVAASPIANDRPKEFTPYLAPLSVTVLDASQLAYGLTIGAVTGGTAQKSSAAGVVVFSPSVGNNGSGSFEFTVRSPCGEQRTGVVTIDVNRPPALSNIGRTISRDTSLTVGVSEQGTDDEAIRFSSASTSTGAVTLAADGRSLRFTPPAGSTGSASIKVVVTDLGGLNASALITVEVTGPPNLAPIANTDQIETRPDSNLVISPLDNDSDPDGPHGDLRVELVDGDVHFDQGDADIFLSADGRSVLVDIPSNAHGRGSFRYRAVDASGARSETVRVSVVVNVPPNAFEFSVTMTRDTSTTLRPLTWKVMDNDGDAVEIVSVRGSDPSYAVALLDPSTMTLTTSIDSPDRGSLTFVVVDAWGARSTSTITVISTS